MANGVSEHATSDGCGSSRLCKSVECVNLFSKSIELVAIEFFLI